MSGTPFPEVPGWYINFLAAVIKQLPRPGQLTQSKAERWVDDQSSLKAALYERLCLPASLPVDIPPVKVVEPKFSLLTDLGTIVVPKKYKHEGAIAAFQKKHRSSFYSWSEAINDTNFSNPSRVLEPGDKLRVRIFKQNVGGTTTSEERLEFLKGLPGAVLVGAQGAALVFDQKGAKLPRGYWHLSFDEKERLWEDAGGCHRVPGVLVHGNGDRDWVAGDFERPWHDFDTLVSFCDETLVPPVTPEST